MRESFHWRYEAEGCQAKRESLMVLNKLMRRPIGFDFDAVVRSGGRDAGGLKRRRTLMYCVNTLGIKWACQLVGAVSTLEEGRPVTFYQTINQRFSLFLFFLFDEE